MTSALVTRTTPGARLDCLSTVSDRDLSAITQAVGGLLRRHQWSRPAEQALVGLALAAVAESSRRTDGITEPVSNRFPSLSEIGGQELVVLSRFWRGLRAPLLIKGRRSAFRFCTRLSRLFASELRRRQRVLKQLSGDLDRAA